MSSRMEFGFTFGRPGSQQSAPLDEDAPLRILILGDFSGASTATDSPRKLPLGQRPVVHVDIDNFDDVLRRFAPRVQTGENGAELLGDSIVFQTLDDFRPEGLAKNHPRIRSLLELRKRLLDPATYEQAASQLRQGTAAILMPADKSDNKPAASVPAPAVDDATALWGILEQQSASDSAATAERLANPASFDIQELIRNVAAPYVIPAADPRRDDYVSIVDRALSDRLSDVLRHPSFQRLEATWRSLRGLISSLDNDREIKIELLDVSRDELLSDVPVDDGQLQQWSLYRRLTSDSGQASVNSPWSLIAADLSITACRNDIELLGALAATSATIQTPLIAAAHSSLLGIASLVESPDPSEWPPLDSGIEEYWQSLRCSPAAMWIGLSLPRVLLRLPYGKETDEVETFPFEEFSQTWQHEDYLWGNAAWLLAGLVAKAFAEEGASMQLGSQLDIEELPAHTFHAEGEDRLQPCAEVAFGGRTAEAILERGLMPLISWKDRNAIRFVRFQSIAEPLTRLAGRWS